MLSWSPFAPFPSSLYSCMRLHIGFDLQIRRFIYIYILVIRHVADSSLLSLSYTAVQPCSNDVADSSLILRGL